MSLYRTSSYWQLLLIAFLCFIIYAEVLQRLFLNWLQDENYSHGLIIAPLIIFILYLERKLLNRESEYPSPIAGLLIITMALLLLLIGTLGAELFIQRISLVFMLSGIIVYLFGFRLLNLLTVPLALLIFSIPIPQIIFNKIAFPLQIIASQIAVWGIRVLGIPSVVKGNIIEILPRGAIQIVQLEVVEACSGIRSLMSLATLAILLAYFTKDQPIKIELRNRDLWRMILLILLAIPTAVFTNSIRVMLTGVLTYSYGRQALQTFYHQISGFAVYLLALIILIGFNYLLKELFKNNSTDEKQTELAENKTEIQARATSCRKNINLLLLFLALGILIVKFIDARSDLTPQRRQLQEFPRMIGNWQQIGSDIYFSPEIEKILQASDYLVRDYVSPDGKVVNLYIGYYNSQRTGVTYHSPQNCLPGTGWELKNPSLITINTASNRETLVNFYVIQNPESRELMIYWYHGRGRILSSEFQAKVYMILDKILKRRSDGAMIRITIPSSENEDAENLRALIDFSTQVIERLPSFVPD